MVVPNQTHPMRVIRVVLFFQLPTDCLQIFLGLLLRVLCGLPSVDIRLQLMDGLIQTLGFLSVGNFATRQIRIGMHTRYVGAEAIEIQSKIVTGVKGGKAPIQGREWRTRIGSGSVGGQYSLGL